MQSPQTPGVYYERVDVSAPAISALRTDIAGFVGIATRGPLHQPCRYNRSANSKPISAISPARVSCRMQCAASLKMAANAAGSFELLRNWRRRRKRICSQTSCPRCLEDFSIESWCLGQRSGDRAEGNTSSANSFETKGQRSRVFGSHVDYRIQSRSPCQALAGSKHDLQGRVRRGCRTEPSDLASPETRSAFAVRQCVDRLRSRSPDPDRKHRIHALGKGTGNTDQGL